MAESVVAESATPAPVVPLLRATEASEQAGVAGHPLPVDLTGDWHVHTDLGRGTASAVAMVDAAEAAGLATVGICDVVTADTGWLDDYAAMVAVFGRETLTVRCGVETAVLDAAGRLDLPEPTPALDYVLVTADHLPGVHGPVGVAQLRADLDAGALTGGRVAELLVEALVAALHAAPAPVVVGRPFSLLPQLGVDDDVVTDALLETLAAAVRETGARVEVDETWRAPSARVAAVLAGAGVELVAGSGAASPRGVGAWRYAATLAGVSTPAESGAAPAADVVAV